MQRDKQAKKRKRIFSPPAHGGKLNASAAQTDELKMSSSSEDDETQMDSSQRASQMSVNEKLDQIIMKLDSMERKFDNLKTTVKENTDKLSSLDKQVDVNSGKILSLELKIDELPSKVDYQKMEEKMDDQANRLRRNNIVLHNVPEESEGKGTYDCSQFVREFIINHMELEEDSWEIERAHRSPTGPPRANRVRPIHVKFLRYQDRVKVLKEAPRKLKDNPFNTKNVFVSDDVTENVRKQRKKLVAMKNKIKERWPGKTVFIPPVVPAILLRENAAGKLVRMYPGDKLPAE